MSHSTSTSSNPGTTTSSDLVGEARAVAERRRIVEEIRTFNPSATGAFLDSFSTEALQEYLHHLSNAKKKSVRLRGWIQLRSAALAQARRQLQQRRAA